MGAEKVKIKRRLTLSGSYYNIGKKLGKIMKEVFVLPPLSKETIEFGQDCKETVKKYAPGIIDELQGVADGRGYDSDVLNAFILTLGFEYEQIGCSIFAVSGEHTVDNVPIFARNYDWFDNFQEYLTAIWLTPNSGYANLAFTDHFIGS